MAKNILICFDGTWNKGGNNDEKEHELTNVWRLYCQAEGKDYKEGKGSSKAYASEQIKWYDAGIGTAWYERLRGGIFGHGMDENIMQGYAVLSELYEEGDRIFLCGFSRGAFTARSLAGLIDACGLVHGDKVHGVKRSRLHALHKRALALYRGDMGPQCEAGRDKKVQVELELELFRHMYTRSVPIECIAVWDTVKALGIPASVAKWLPFGLGERHAARYAFHNTRLSKAVRHAYHALAIDEHRPDFAPVLWDDVAKVASLGATESVHNLDDSHAQDIEQRWFCGAHSDVGGGYASRALSDMSLVWIQDKVQHCGLLLKPVALPHHEEQDCAPITDSFRDFYILTHPWRRRYRRPLHAKNSTVRLDPSATKRLAVNPSYVPQNSGLCTLIEQAQKP